MIEKLYTVEEVAELASVTGRTIRNYLKSGRLVGRKIGGQWRFPESEVQRLLNGGEAQESDDTYELPYTEAPQAAPAAPEIHVAPPYEEAPPVYEETPQVHSQMPDESSYTIDLPSISGSQEEEEPEAAYEEYPAPAPLPVKEEKPDLPEQPAAAPSQAKAPEPAPETDKAQAQAPAQQPQAEPAMPAQPQGMPAPAAMPGAPVYTQAPGPYPYAPSPYAMPYNPYTGAIQVQAPVYAAPPVVGGYYPMPQAVMPAAPAPAPQPEQKEEPKPEPAPAPEPKMEEEPTPEMSDVARRVTRFVSEVHDCSKGPQICAVVDLNQSLSSAKTTSEHLTEIARAESDASGQLCECFVEFDERYYIARYTLFGTSTFLDRCLKIVG